MIIVGHCEDSGLSGRQSEASRLLMRLLPRTDDDLDQKSGWDTKRSRELKMCFESAPTELDD